MLRVILRRRVLEKQARLEVWSSYEEFSFNARNYLDVLFGGRARIEFTVFPRQCVWRMAFFSKILGRRVYVYIHEPVITKNRISSYFKQILQDLILLVTTNIGVQDGDYLKLLFRQKTIIEARDSKAETKVKVLFFGKWLRGKVNPECIHQARAFFDERYILIRAGQSYSQEFNKHFDVLHDGFIDFELKEKLFNQADFLFLPYHPTAQSGVYVDALSYGLPVVCSRSVYTAMHGKLNNLLPLSDVLELDKEIAYQRARKCLAGNS